MMGTKERNFRSLPEDISLEDLVPGTTSTAVWSRASISPS